MGVYGCEVGVVWGFGFSIRGVGGALLYGPQDKVPLVVGNSHIVSMLRGSLGGKGLRFRV